MLGKSYFIRVQDSTPRNTIENNFGENMKLTVDNDLKKKIRIENRKNRRGIYILWIFEKVILVVVVFLIITFPVYCRITGSYISTNMRTGENSYFLVAMLTSIIAGMGLVLVLLVSVVRKRIENVIIGERVDETIEVLEDKLFYTFRKKYYTLVNLVIVDLNKIKNIEYDIKLAEINVEGMMIEKTLNISLDIYKIETSEMTNSKLKLWDYFNPSLYELLTTKAGYYFKDFHKGYQCNRR